MRITHLIRSDGWAGVEAHVARLALEQIAMGHTVHMIGGDPDALTSSVTQFELRHTPAHTLLGCVRVLNRSLIGDILHVHMTAAELAAAVSVRSHDVPVVSTRHFARTRGASTVRRMVAWVGARRVGAQIAVSQFVADHVEGDSVVILPGVQDQDDGAPACDRERVVLVAQRLQPEKETDLAIAAFAESGLAGSGWRLDIAGDGRLRDSLEVLAAELGVGDAVRFLGTRTDVPALMARAGLLLAPGHREGYGLTVVEAMAAGLPVVAAAGGGHLETVGPVPGAAMFTPCDASHAGRLLCELASDPLQRDQYARASQERQRQTLSLRAQATATETVYRGLL